MGFFANVAKSLYIGETGFNEDETNCGIAHILGILVMRRLWTIRYFQ